MVQSLMIAIIAEIYTDYVAITNQLKVTHANVI